VNVFVDHMFCRIWWRYQPSDNHWFNSAYHWFNLAEGCIWLVFAGLVLIRYFKHRKSCIELWYALAFATFAVSDFREAWQQSSWLIWLKLFNLMALARLRRRVMSVYSPNAKVY